MRIALIAPLVTALAERHIGGAQAVLADLAQGLTARGHDVVVFAARGSAIPGVRFAGVDIDAGALRSQLVRPGGERAPTAAMDDAYRSVYGAVRDGRFDVVHNHGFDAPAVSVAAAMGVAVLHTLHLPPAPDLVAALEQARSTASAVWTAGVSRAHVASWRSLTAIDAVLRNGVPTGAIPFHSAPGSGAVVAARFSPEKGVDEAIAAARDAHLGVEVYGTPYHGAYEQSVRARWRADAEVTFHEPLPRRQLWAALGRAAVVVCLPRWEEPFGMVAAEAQAAGTPVVAARSGGLAEVVQDGVSGWLVPPRDTAAARDALSRVQAISRESCRRHAHATLGVDAAVAAHETLYTRIAQQ